MPARLPAARYQNVLNLAKVAADALGCSGAVRVDMLVTPGENEYVLEVNTLPGMTPTSLLPKIAAAAGYGFADLCEAILAGARLHTPQRETQPQPQSQPQSQPQIQSTSTSTQVMLSDPPRSLAS
jgi:D-alanine-D-alanine ligase